MPVDSCDVVMPDVNIPDVVVSVKQNAYLSEQPLSSSSFVAEQIGRARVESVKDLSAIAPNFFQPDYGSSMTSSMYVRGFGSRIDQPVLGLNVDDVPVMNKNGYDFDLFDIYGIDVLRGPQGTLYGRNTSGGVINLRTLSPMNYTGTLASVDYGTANSLRVKLSHYMRPSEHTGVAVGAFYSRTDGFFHNAYTDEMCDDGYRGAVRLRVVHNAGRVRVDNTLSASYVDEGGYAYRPAEGDGMGNIDYNDPSRYVRRMVSNGISLRMTLSPSLTLSSVTGLSFLDDDMTLDNDFTAADIFTLRQKQREFSATQEFVLKSTDPSRKWQHISGVFGFYKDNDMEAPVNMHREGIESLILSSANKGISRVLPGHGLYIEEDELEFAASFRIPVYGAAIYHQSDLTAGRLKFTLGLRADYESTYMRYRSHMDLNYRFSLTMPSYAPLSSEFNGRQSQDTFELLPKAAVTYRMRSGNIYAAVSRGYKAGGFNTQIFSDILRSRLMTDMMAAVGMGGGGSSSASVYDSASATAYKPEYAWNYEVGSHFSLGDFSADAALFYIDCRNQQLTVFPSTTSFGRIMSNAGHSASYGVEMSGAYSLDALQLNASYGYTHAEFSEYNDGTADYSGNRIPYAPQSMLSLSGLYSIEVSGGWCDGILLRLQWDRIGKIYWTDDNSLCQKPYSLLSASAMVRKGACEFSVWGKNLTDSEYGAFYFESLGKGFFSAGKPLRVGVSVSFKM